MAWRTKISTLIMALMILPFSMMSVQAQMLVQEQLASQFAEEKFKETNVIKAIKDAEEKFAKAAKENKSANMIQCGKSTCDLETHKCYEVVTTTIRGSIGGSSSNVSYQCIEQQTEVSNTSGQVSVTYHPCSVDCFKKEGFLNKGDFIEATDADGNKYRIYIGSDTISIQYDTTGNNGKTFRGCEVLPVKLHNYGKCFLCPLLGVIYDSCAKLSDRSFPALANSFVALLVIGMGIWIAIQVLGQISSLTKQDAQKFLGSLIKQGYKLLIAVFLLLNSQQIFNYGVRPLIDAGLTFGKQMLDTDYNPAQHNRIAHGIPGGVYLKVSTYDQIEQYVVAIQGEIAFMQAVGTSLWCIGGNSLIGRGPNNLWKDIGNGLEMLIQGGIIAVFAFLLSIAFIFYLIDAIVQLGIVAALSPFLIASWPFKATAKYTKTGINMFLNSVFVFIFVGLVISMNFKLLEQTLGNSAGTRGLSAIAEAINAQDANKLVEYTELTGSSFLILIFCCIFGFKFANKAGELASKFAGGFMTAGKKPIAPSIATMGVSAAKNFALNSTKNTRKSIEKRIDKAGTAIAMAPYNLFKSIANNAQKQIQENKKTLSPKPPITPNVNHQRINPVTPSTPNNRNGTIHEQIKAAQKPKQPKTTFKTNKFEQTNKRTKKGGSSRNRKRKGRRK